MTPERAIVVAWALWVASWIVAARWSDPAATRATFREQASSRASTLAGAILMFAGWVGRSDHAPLKLWRLGEGVSWVLVAVVTLGLLFTWWARLYLGRLWSSSVTKKADHRVVETGPYAIVRHPIYTGLIAASLATALLEGAVAGIIGAMLMTLGFVLKAKLEERFLREQLGPEAYDVYRRRAPMLMPFGPKPS